MRLFISIDVPKELRKYCRNMQKEFYGIRKTKNFHLTLQFLGDGIKSAKQISDALYDIKFKAFEIEMGDAVLFGSPAKGVWIECKIDSSLKKLSKDINSKMKKIGYAPDKPFKAHITLGRYKEPPQKKTKEIKGKPNKFSVDHFCLMQSKMSEAGSTHKKISRFNAISN